jgi:hypothetical protein
MSASGTIHILAVSFAFSLIAGSCQRNTLIATIDAVEINSIPISTVLTHQLPPHADEHNQQFCQLAQPTLHEPAENSQDNNERQLTHCSKSHSYSHNTYTYARS